MQRIKNQQGFSAHLILIVVLVSTVIGFAGWLVLQNQTDDTNAAQTGSSDTAAKKTAKPQSEDSEAKQATTTTESGAPAGSEKDFSPPAPTATTKLTVHAVKDRPGTDFAKEGYTPPQGNQRVVYLTISNTGTTDQKYDFWQFSAVTSNGAVVESRKYSPLESTLWHSTTLQKGGKQDIVVLFATDQDVVTLQWRATPQDEPLTVSLPKAIPL